MLYFCFVLFFCIPLNIWGNISISFKLWQSPPNSFHNHIMLDLSHFDWSIYNYLAHTCEGLPGLKRRIISAVKSLSLQIISNNELFHSNLLWVIKRLICQCWFWQVLQPERAEFTTVLYPNVLKTASLHINLIYIVQRGKRDAVIIFQNTSPRL